MSAHFDPIIGRYMHVTLQGRGHRVYFEEAGRGIPLLCLHTAGADGRQFRHMMTDRAITDHFRVVAFDMPWHGKSTPPDGWQDEEYRLTTENYIEAIRVVRDALGLERPVVGRRGTSDKCGAVRASFAFAAAKGDCPHI